MAHFHFRCVLCLCLLSALSYGQQTGIISGTVTDRSGAAVPGVHLKIQQQEILSGPQGEFIFENIAPGPFHLLVNAGGFGAMDIAGTLQPGQSLDIEPVLEVASLTTDVQVTLTQTELAEQQIKAQEHQRLIGVIPNFNVVYAPNPEPLTPKQKFELAGKSIIDPVTFLVNGFIAGIQQSQNDFKDFGQGSEGYAKRYAASYASFVTGTLMTSAVFPSIFKQDPRYIYKGTGTTKSRVLYALSQSFMCRGDNRKMQFNYSGILGGLAAGGISNLYYPAKSRDGTGVTFENALIGLAANAGSNIFQEFFSRRFTPKSQLKP